MDDAATAIVAPPANPTKVRRNPKVKPTVPFHKKPPAKKTVLKPNDRTKPPRFVPADYVEKYGITLDKLDPGQLDVLLGSKCRLSDVYAALRVRSAHFFDHVCKDADLYEVLKRRRPLATEKLERRTVNMAKNDPTKPLMANAALELAGGDEQKAARFLGVSLTSLRAFVFAGAQSDDPEGLKRACSARLEDALERIAWAALSKMPERIDEANAAQLSGVIESAAKLKRLLDGQSTENTAIEASVATELRDEISSRVARIAARSGAARSPEELESRTVEEPPVRLELLGTPGTADS